jgi:threonine/homoserine/homoserine lactone efflux protein
VPDASTLGLFSLAALALLVIPGPAVTYIVMRSVDQGRTAGFVSILGIHTGSAVHVAAAVVGLSALLASSASAFTVVKLAGAAYLIFIGLRRLLTPEPAPDAEPVRTGLRRVYVQGFVVNLLNPKTALFFLAFLPQFVDPARGAVPFQVAILGVLFIGLGLLSDGTYALVASAAGRRLRASSGFRRVQRYVSGTVYVGLGVTAALTGSRAKP